MNPAFWLILRMDHTTEVFEFDSKDTLNLYLTNIDTVSNIREVEVISGFSLTKRVRDGA